MTVPARESRLSALSTADDISLMAAVAARWTEAIDAVYERHADALYSMAVIVLDDVKLAQDAVEESMLELWRNIGVLSLEGQSLRAALAGRIYSRARATQRRIQGRRGARRARQLPGLSELSLPQRDLMALVLLGDHTRTRAARRVGLAEDVARSTLATCLRTSPRHLTIRPDTAPVTAATRISRGRSLERGFTRSSR